MTGGRSLDAAHALLAARESGAALAPLPATCRPEDLDAGYSVQRALHALLDARGEDHAAGYKIGCTTPVMQAFLDIAHPCAGRMRSAGVHHGEARIRIAAHVRLAVEAEIAVTLGEALAPGDAPFGRDDVAAAVSACHASIEIVDDRYVDFRTLGVPTLVADDFFHAGCVVGAPVTDWRALDLAAIGCTLDVDGVVEGEGRGADIMGHPLEALTWLANDAASRGDGLARGALVTLGSMVETRWIDGPCEVEVRLDGLGAARARFV